jgi:hypothetical protein
VGPWAVAAENSKDSDLYLAADSRRPVTLSKLQESATKAATSAPISEGISTRSRPDRPKERPCSRARLVADFGTPPLTRIATIGIARVAGVARSLRRERDRQLARPRTNESAPLQPSGIRVAASAAVPARGADLHVQTAVLARLVLAPATGGMRFCGATGARRCAGPIRARSRGVAMIRSCCARCCSM